MREEDVEERKTLIKSTTRFLIFQFFGWKLSEILQPHSMSLTQSICPQNRRLVIVGRMNANNLLSWRIVQTYSTFSWLFVAIFDLFSFVFPSILFFLSICVQEITRQRFSISPFSFSLSARRHECSIDTWRDRGTQKGLICVIDFKRVWQFSLNSLSGDKQVGISVLYFDGYGRVLNNFKKSSHLMLL